jgi:hypothetical protein
VLIGIEVIVAVIANFTLELSRSQSYFGILAMLMIAAIFWRIKYFSISGVNKGDVIGSFVLALFWTVYFAFRIGNDPILAAILVPAWIMPFHSLYLLRKQVKEIE